MDIKNFIVNYHYVEDPRPDFSGIWPCSISEFERQIKFLSGNFSIVSAVDVYRASQENSGGNYCAITFDDGLRDQYQNAVPILKKYNATATFFIITDTLNGFLPPAHQIHFLLSKVPAEKLIDLFNDFQNQYQIPKDRRVNPKKRLFEDILIANFKETMMSAPQDLTEPFLGHCFENLSLDPEKFGRGTFMDEPEILSLRNTGFSIGSHAHKHYLEESINQKYFPSEVRDSKKILGRLLGEDPTIFSYPHGRHNNEVIALLKEEGFKHAFITDPRPPRAGDNPYLIPRLDTNDIKKLIY
ncbi:MAG: polysaccharide deacetylase family protein [Candidatus Harrisonbacteria bacterium]|nr:polysaccharide deacetylase family protein [Candidatus Harrisonbacteria bacterium]